MNVTYFPSLDRLSAPSDLDEKLVFSSLDGTGMTSSVRPEGVISRRKSREVTPQHGPSLCQDIPAHRIGTGGPAPVARVNGRFHSRDLLFQSESIARVPGPASDRGELRSLLLLARGIFGSLPG